MQNSSATILFPSSVLRRPARCAIHWLAIVVAVATFVQPSGNTWADMVVLQSGISPSGTYQTQDAHVRSDQITTTDNNTRILFGYLPTGVFRGLYSYPLTDIPAGATINSVEFHVMQIDTDTNAAAVGGNFTVELRTISQSFSQGGGVNWDNTFGSNGSMTLGGTVLSSTTMNPKPAVLPVLTTPSTWIEHTFATSSSLVAAVQTQLTANQPFNFALVASPEPMSSGIRSFIRTASNSDASASNVNRPWLIIDYTVSSVPEASSFAFFSIAMCVMAGPSLLMARGRRSARPCSRS